MKIFSASLFLLLIYNPIAHAENVCKDVHTYKILPEAYCIDQISFQETYRAVVYYSLASSKEERPFVRYKAAVNAYIALHYFVGGDIIRDINRINHRKNTNKEYKDSIEKWLVEQFQESTLKLSDEKRKILTERSIQNMIGILDDRFARYCIEDCYIKSLGQGAVDTSVFPIEMFSEDIAYLKITSFSRTTPRAVRNKLATKKNVTGIILDLRDNLGGIVWSSADTADLFLTKGLITTSRCVSGDTKFEANGEDISDGARIVLLGNKMSASGSEIVLLALQEHDRGTFIGTTSNGKGSVQHVHTLPNGKKIVWTSGYYYSPNGKNVDGVGIKPDIIVDAASPGCTINGSKVSDKYKCAALAYLSK